MTAEQETQFKSLAGEIELHQTKAKELEERLKRIARSLKTIAKAIEDTIDPRTVSISRPIIEPGDDDTYDVRVERGRIESVKLSCTELHDALSRLAAHDTEINNLRQKLNEVKRGS